MITEDYVSLETVKLLKEKGFECNYKNVIALEDIIEERFEGRTCVGKELIPAGTFFTPEFGGEYETYNYSPNLFTASAPCPTQAMAMKWLREVHNIHIVVHPYTDKEGHHFSFLFDSYAYGCWQELGIYITDSWSTYEEACEAAIKYCLENLI